MPREDEFFLEISRLARRRFYGNIHIILLFIKFAEIQLQFALYHIKTVDIEALLVSSYDVDMLLV